MPFSIIAVDGSVRTFGGSIVNDSGGAGCCCGCNRLWKANQCNPGSCIPAGDAVIYICKGSGCLACPGQTPGCGGGNQLGPVVNGTVIKINGVCYIVDTTVEYCLPGAAPPPTIPPNDPAAGPTPCLPLPNGATIYGGLLQQCWQNCQPPHCPPIQGWYPMVPCFAPVPGAVPVWVTCECFQHAQSLGYPCPTWQAGNQGCYHVPAGAIPTATPPPGVPFAITISCNPGAQTYQNCCECVRPTTPPGCCLCTADSVLVRYLAGNPCQIITETTPRPCSLWARQGSSIQGCGYRRQRFFNFITGLFQPVSLECWRSLGSNTIEHKVYTFDQDPGAPNQVTINCLGGCGGSMTGALLSEVTDPLIVLDECALPPVLPMPATSGGINQCCATGQTLQTCTQGQINLFVPGGSISGCSGDTVEMFGAWTRQAAAGSCGANPCATDGLILPDGSPASRLEVIRSTGCAGCGEGQARTAL